MVRLSQYDKGFLDGRIKEAKVQLENIISLKDELDSVGYDSKRTFLNILIKDLQKFLDENK